MTRAARRPRRLPLLAVLVAVALVSVSCRYEIDLDPVAPAAQSSHVVASDGTIVATLDAGENRTSVALDEMARAVADAVVAIEDHRFFDHDGVDVRAIARAFARNAEAGELMEGGSTITQQYVRMVMLGRERTVNRKVREAVLALEIERRLTKEEILERYLNHVYLGNGAYGVEAASDLYFGLEASKLSLSQAALLAALIRAPERYNPIVAADLALRRRNLVLDKMAEHGFAGREAVADAKGEPLGVVETSSTRGRYPSGHFVERVKQFVLDDERFGETREERTRLLFQGGLRIETTLDPRLQLLAEDSVRRILVDPEHDPSAALVTIDPRTGEVLAYVGGRDFFGHEPYAKFDLASQARRQAGSAFKPLVLAAALTEDIPLSRAYPAPPEIEIPMRGQAPWEVRNYDGGGGGEMNLVDATVASVNTVYAQLVMDVGAQDVVDLAALLGVRSPLSPYPSAALGTNGVSALDMASAYATFAADGLHAEPTFVRRVTTADGTVLYESAPQRERVIPAETARQVNAVLEQVVSRGTGVNARIGRPVAGKTGTGEEWRDAWFVGSSPELTTAVWVGFADAERSMVPPTTRALVTGGLWPAQIWGLFMGAALADTPISEFPAPTTAEGAEVKATPIPDVVGMPGSQASALLSDAGYAVSAEERPNRDYPPGTVLEQRPAAHSPITPGTAVTLVVARVPERVTVPLMLGSLADEAVFSGAAVGLPVTIEIEAEFPSGSHERAGRAWKQSPVAGATVDEGTAVIVWVNP